MTRLLVVGCLVLTILGGAGLEALLACSCAPPPPPKKSLEQAKAVFSGKVTKVAKTDNFMHQVTFAVDKQWKGITTKEVTVLTASNGAACGYGFEEGKAYLVYCYQPQNEKHLHTNICTRTCAMADAKADLAEIGKGEDPKR